MSQYNSQDKDDGKSNKKNKKKESPSKKNTSKQGKLNPAKPFAKISKYESEDENESNEEMSDVSREEIQVPSNVPIGDVWNSADNRFKSVLKNKAILAGQDFCQVMAKKQGAGSGGVRGIA